MSNAYQLGCGGYRVLIQPRCGGSFTCELDASSIQFNRILNEISQATVDVPIRGNCCECIGQVNPWQHELVIYRNDEMVWVGPIIDMEFNIADEVVSIFARDLLTWADHRLVELADEPYEPEATDLADAYVWLLNHAYCKDPWCMTWGIDPVGIPVERYYPAFDKLGGEKWGGRYPTVGDELRTLSQAGIDYTVIGRHLWGGNVQVTNPISSNVILLDKHFRSAPTVKVAGSKMTNRVVSAGGQSGYEGFFEDQVDITPVVPGPITPALLDGFQLQYGLLESLITTDMYDEVDTSIIPNAIGQAAKSKWDLLHLPYAYITGGDLTPDVPMTFAQTLIPGGIVRVALESTCWPLSQPTMRLTEVSVSVDENDETVSIKLTPLGTQGTN